MIATAYSFYSKPAAVMAQMIGQQDELEAKEIHSNNGQSLGCFVGTSFQKTVIDFPTMKGMASAALNDLQF